MGNKRVMLPASEVDLTAVTYIPENIQAPHLTGFWLKLFVKFVEAPGVGSLIMNHLKNENKIDEKLKYTVIPEGPMFKPEFPPQEPEPAVVSLEEDVRPEDRVGLALKYLPEYDPASNWSGDSSAPFRYWKIRDYAYAYRSKFTTPSMVAERFISAIEEFNSKNPAAPLLISFDPDELRKQAAASTQRFEQGNPLSILDGTFMAIKDDIDCYPHPSKGATTWMHEVREVTKDAVSVSRLRSCGAILVGKANMHELGLGTTGNNANYGTTRNPHDPERYTGGSSSGPAAIVASGLCSAALGTDGGGSVRIPSSLCGVVGLKSTYGRTDMTGSLCDDGTVEIIGPIATTVEDTILVYAAILGPSPADRISLRPVRLETTKECSLPCVPNFPSRESSRSLESLRLGKYTEWFNDVFSTDISDKCENVLSQLSEKHGCKTVEIVIPELHEMRIAHIVSIGSESLCSLNPDCGDGRGARLTYDTRTNLAFFRSFTAADYVAAQRLRRRLMYFHMEIFKKVDIIVTPTTGMTAPRIPPTALKVGETDLQVSGNLMRFIITANLLGLPAVTVPVGYDKQGLPIGMQLIGRPWCEASILRLAAAIEETCAEPKKKPLQYYDILKGN
ncbi:fatty acid amide hydrolase-like isoform X1 [Solanum pennellii]|uniref:Fatty acid amide hydrolase-like isoform X1 n=1 Tax=Solanum pennellii TaxID=28526 RepID=A0ABM1VFE5_SOLPN|nr:fatty acid amide hydrolase-like isoform X1 [Solanum pennellii]